MLLLIYVLVTGNAVCYTVWYSVCCALHATYAVLTIQQSQMIEIQ